MEKQEFLDQLRMALNGRIPTSMVTDNVNYYDDYINTEIRKGKNKEAVMEMLGDPRLIAKTIIQTQNKVNTYNAQTSEYREFYDENRNETERQGDAFYGENSRKYDDEAVNKSWKRFAKMPKWLWTVITVLVIIVIVVVVFRVLSFLAPLLIILSAVMLMVKIFRDWLN